ncbi:hypothetical protein KQI61_04475 [Anaerocolumna aminovalerica]|uniref:hypothetical protein n=1 Tax=Anaerocolumna aminovalerica TaxID=1527 RepID=UPI001C0F3173|nr:hypothetical protein [Anaerocolumna aminovalerica]MBU5331443.1 hypothetical protein [Anaerocolumna aminovalerica]
MTQKELREKSNYLKEGDIVTIVKRCKEEDGRTSRLTRTKGKIIKKYPHIILVGKGEDFKTLESFTYLEVAQGCLVKEKEKKYAKK